jgi:hypothetical protein
MKHLSVLALVALSGCVGPDYSQPYGYLGSPNYGAGAYTNDTYYDGFGYHPQNWYNNPPAPLPPGRPPMPVAVTPPNNPPPPPPPARRPPARSQLPPPPGPDLPPPQAPAP